MLVNILTVRCNLPFAPYLAESAAEFLKDGIIAPRVVRQGGRGLILRSDGDLVLRHEHRQAALGAQESRHYSATIQLRNEFYDVLRMQDEVVLATTGDELLLSHPQSEIWLNRESVGALVSTFACNVLGRPDDKAVHSPPGWLKISTGGERMLLSDERSGRWVLLASDHLNELERRLAHLRPGGRAASAPPPPTVSLKGLTVHLQSAFRLLATLIDFSLHEHVTPFEEITPGYSLKALESTGRLELSDSDNRVALTPREARKWAVLTQTEIERLNARQVERGAIRTVFAGDENGRWILQWGDEVFLPGGALSRSFGSSSPAVGSASGDPIVRRVGNFLLLLSPETGSCVALTDSEAAFLDDSD